MLFGGGPSISITNALSVLRLGANSEWIAQVHKRRKAEAKAEAEAETGPETGADTEAKGQG